MRQPADFVSVINDILNQMEQLKIGTQYFGSDSLITYKTSTTNQYDYTTTLSLGEKKRYRVTFNHAIAKDHAIIQMNIFYSLDNANVMSDPIKRHPGFNPHVTVVWGKETYGETFTTWIVEIENISFSLTPVPYLKFFFDGTDSGTFVIDQI